MSGFRPTAAGLHGLLIREYDPVSAGRGVGYARDRRVQDVEVEPFEDGWSVTARVKGSVRVPYEVELLLLPGPGNLPDIEQRCSCPVGEFCKHGAALVEILAAHPERWFTDLAGTPVPRPEPERRTPRTSKAGGESVSPGQSSPALAAALRDWVAALTRAAEPPPAAIVAKPGVEPSERVVYLLKFNGRRLVIDVAWVRRLRNGDWGAATVSSWNALTSEAGPWHGATPEDRRLARTLALAQSSFAAWPFVLVDAGGAELLREFLATGRCYWQNAGRRAAALSLGPVRRAEPGWESMPDGAQRPILKIDPPATALFDLVPLWYLDQATHQCGPVECPLAPPVARLWNSAPSVEPEQAADLLAALQIHTPRLPVPLPAALPVEWIEDLRPVPVLTLLGTRVTRTGRAFLWELPKPDPTVGLARLSFDYGSVRVWIGDSKPFHQERTESGFRRYRRNLEMESRHERELGRVGLGPAGQSDWEYDWGKHRHDYVAQDDEGWITFVEKEVPRLRARGWEIVIEPTFPWRLAHAEEWFADARPFPSTGEGPQQDWFGVELGAVVDGERVNLLPLLVRLIAADPFALAPERLDGKDGATGIPLTLPDGRTLMFPIERARTLRGVLLDLFEPRALGDDGRLRLGRLRAAELAGEADWRWMGPEEIGALARRLRDFRGIAAVPAPDGLRASLRSYQQEGLNWLQFLREHEVGGILADDMGLGKTVQTLAHLLVEKASGRADRPSLVVAPTSLMTNWRQEAERFAPDLRVLVLHGLDRHDHFDRIRDHDVVLTTYPLLPRDLPQLERHPFHCLILDEAQFIKNPLTAAARAAAQLTARHRLCLSGTPMENHLGELWSLFHFLLPGFLGDQLHFQRNFRRPIEKGGDDGRRALLARRVKPFLLRRRKEEVARELPPKTEIVQNVELGGAQRDLYESVRLAMHERIREEVAKKGFSRAHIVILDALLKLRQICCHPALLDLPSARGVTESAKLELLLELLPPLIAEGRRILLFSQFTSMLALVETELRKLEIPYVLLTGDTRDRATPIGRFQAGEVPLFLISLKAGGTGLNLTAADTVIHYDPWWNPAVENQATDRAHRIGQEKQVFVYKLLTVGTVEEKIAALQARKRELVAGLLDTEQAGKLQLTHEDIEALFAPVG